MIIHSIEKLPRCITFDIQVDSPDHVYMIQDGDGEIPVHNTVSLVAGVHAPGAHFPLFKEYGIRRVRIQKNSKLIPILRKSGYPIEPTKYDDSSVCVSFPLQRDPSARSESDVTIEEKFQLLKLIQDYWADNQVSMTISFDPVTEAEKIKPLLLEYGDQIKSVSLLPKCDGVYDQMPYEEITKEKYDQLFGNLKPFDISNKTTEISNQVPDLYCDGDTCNRKID